MADAKPKTASCSFRDPAKPDEISIIDVAYDTGLNASVVAIRSACEMTARGLRAHYFAMAVNEIWTVWEMRNGKFGFMLREFPSRAAAEMWMLHRG